MKFDCISSGSLSFFLLNSDFQNLSCILSNLNPGGIPEILDL